MRDRTEPPTAPLGAAPVPVLRPAGRRGQRSFTLILAGAAAVLILLRVLTTHPLPTPSHLTSSAAAAGYLIGLEHKNVGEVRRYLAPDQKPQARSVVRAFTSRHVYVVAPALAFATQGSSRATVTIYLQVCSPVHYPKQYTCEPVAHAPLGLPDELTCAKIDGEWYVTTLFKPR